MTARRLLLAGLVVSLVCLAYLFAGAVRSARQDPDIFGLQGSTAVSPVGQTASAIFGLLNIPPMVILLALEALLPAAMQPLQRAVAVYAVALLATLAWWWLLASLVRRRPKST